MSQQITHLYCMLMLFPGPTARLVQNLTGEPGQKHRLKWYKRRQEGLFLCVGRMVSCSLGEELAL